MKIAIFYPAFAAVGGAELLAVEHARCFREAGHDVSLATFVFDTRVWRPRLPEIKVTLVPQPSLRERLTLVSHRDRLERQAELAARAVAGADLVIAYNYPSSAILGRMKTSSLKFWHSSEPPRRLHVRGANPTLTQQASNGTKRANGSTLLGLERFEKLLTQHDRDERWRLFSYQHRLLDVEASKGLDSIYANSRFCRDNVRGVYGRCAEEAVPPMIAFGRPGRTRTGIDRTNLNVLVHCRLEALKNVDTVLRGFHLFRQTRSRAAVLHIVGAGRTQAALEKLARRLGLGSSVRFHGFLREAELDRVYDSCDVFALLPLDEPFGMVFPEAAAKGLLLVGPSHGGPREILDDGRLGALADAFSPEALAAALEEVTILSDAAVDRRREAALAACTDRYGRATLWRQMKRILEMRP